MMSHTHQAYPIIDYERTCKHLRSLILDRNPDAKIIQEYMNLSTTRTVYKWYQLYGSLPCLEHFYALSVLLVVSINDIIIEEQFKSQGNSDAANNPNVG